MSQRIFISYRRDDSRGYAGRLQGDLSRRYTEEHVFRDIEIPPGADFGEYITGLVDKCNVVLAIIGPGWLDARDREGERRIDDPDDWVRLEIERALARDGVEVIPVLAATSLPTWVAGGLGALIVVLESIQQLFQFHSNWTHYRSTSEALKHEKYLYLAQAGSYATATHPEALLAERIESRVSQEHSAWASEQNQGQGQGQPK